MQVQIVSMLLLDGSRLVEEKSMPHSQPRSPVISFGLKLMVAILLSVVMT